MGDICLDAASIKELENPVLSGFIQMFFQSLGNVAGGLLLLKFVTKQQISKVFESNQRTFMACGGQDELDAWAEEFSIQKSTVEALRREEYELRDVLDLTETDIQALNGGQGLKGGPKRRLVDSEGEEIVEGTPQKKSGPRV